MSAMEVARRAWFTLRGLQAEIGDMVRMRNRETFRVARCGNFKKMTVLIHGPNGRVECEMKYIGAEHGQKFFYSEEAKTFYYGPSNIKGKLQGSNRHATIVMPIHEDYQDWQHLIRAMIASQKKAMGEK